MSKDEHLEKTSFTNAICTSKGVLNTPQLSYFTNAKKHRSTLGINFSWQFSQADLLVDWGNKRHSVLAPISSQKNIPILSLEDGFIRSLGLGVNGSRTFSIISDWTGIYYDATRASDLENILQGYDPRSQKISALEETAKKLIDQICLQEISKYNHAPALNLGKKDKPRILLIDQTFGDQSIKSGMASQQSFEEMLSDAIADSEQLGAELLIKTHPDVIAGKKKGYLGKRSYPEQVKLIAEDCNPLSLLKQVDDVRVVTSQMGFEACLLGLNVTCYGAPFYSGWGITKDKISIPRRTKTHSIERVFTAAYLLYPSYFHPETGELSNLEAVIEHISRQKYYWQKNQGAHLCIGFDRWKHSYVRLFLKSEQNQITFKNRIHIEDLSSKPKIVVWGNNIHEEDRALLEQKNIPISTMEDGFIRSVQLGKYGTAPRSLVIDTKGIYFDPSLPSDLEVILQNIDFTEEDEQQARKIQHVLIQQKISKYNIGDRTSLNLRPKENSTQKVILVPGQVNTDVSILKGSSHIKTNAALLKAVRKANPEAYIIYKPHPDVMSGNIIEEKHNYLELADHIETEANIHLCIKHAEEVHTMTSLVGFEALLQGKKVYCYGSPFYSGWGLTTDIKTANVNEHSLNERRTRKLNLAQLISGTLVKYPRYIDLQTGDFTNVNQTLLAIKKELDEKGDIQLQDSFISRWLLKVRYGGLGMLRNWFKI